MPSSSPPNAARRPCPLCSGALRRVHRMPTDRTRDDAASIRRYQCRAAGCGWEGLLPQYDMAGAPIPATEAGPPRIVRWFAMLLLGLFGMATAAWVAQAPWRQAHPPQAMLGTPAGESDDGLPLPPGHPLLADDPQAPAAANATAALTLRQGCAWGKPGSNPYRGTVEQVLVAARLPAESVAQISARIHARQVSDRLEISREGIRGLKSGLQFDPGSFAMSFGTTLCVNSRVNFAPGHTEMADLYQVMSADGRAMAVMVPDVCGNVSVLGGAGHKRARAGTVAGAVAQRLYAMVGGDVPVRFLADDGAGVRTVPEPDSLWLVLTALGVLLWRSRRRR